MINRRLIGDFLVLFIFMFIIAGLGFMSQANDRLEKIEKHLENISANQTDLDMRIDETQELVLRAIASFTGKPQMSQKEWASLYGTGTTTTIIDDIDE